MKNHYLLLALTVSAFGCASAKPLLVNSQPTQIAQASQIANNSASQADSQTAQGVAAKVTVRIRVGQGLGSGVLLGKKGNTYLVLTNAHVVREAAGISIQTPDGQSYTARKVKDPQVGNFDVALLEFTSNRDYQLAKLDVSSKDEFALREGKPIFAAGFARDSNTLKFVTGEVKQLPQEPFVNGTQVGYATKGDIEQGMSGGPILDESGNLVGINSTYAYPIKPVYTYADGSKAPPDKVAEYRQANWGVPIYNLLTRLNPDILYSYKQLPKLHRTVTPSGYMAELDRKARLVTVRLENSGGHGSGVIVARDGNSYSVLTAAHVVKNIQNLRVITHDQRTYMISPSEIKRSKGIDLAILKFTSTHKYQTATLGNYSVLDRDYSLSSGAVVFSGGWPAPTTIGSQQWQWQLNAGIISSKKRGEFRTQDKLSFSSGYDLIYSSITYAGMSGGPVFDNAGRVIGIHGKAEGNILSKNVLGNSLGISIKTFLSVADRLHVNKRNLRQSEAMNTVDLDDRQLISVNLVRDNISTPNGSNDAERWIEYGNQLYRLGKYSAASKAFDRAISLKPTLLDAYYGKGLVLQNNEDYFDAIKAFDKAISLVPSDYQPQFYYLWAHRSYSLYHLGKYPEALVAISQAISLQPHDILLLRRKARLLSNLEKYAEAVKIYDEIIFEEQKIWAYTDRGIAKLTLGDKKGAIADFDSALSIDPEDKESIFYRNFLIRGHNFDFLNLRNEIAKYDRVILANSQDAEAYHNRARIKDRLGNLKEAMADFDSALAINPQYADAYVSRGFLKNKLGNYKGALLDFNSVIRINSQDEFAYMERGYTKSKLGDKKGAIADLNIAAKLYKSQNNRDFYDVTIDLIRRISD